MCVYEGEGGARVRLKHLMQNKSASNQRRQDGYARISPSVGKDEGLT